MIVEHCYPIANLKIYRWHRYRIDKQLSRVKLECKQTGMKWFQFNKSGDAINYTIISVPILANGTF